MTRKHVIQRADGYRMVFAPEHPDARGKGYVYEHRLVASEMLGRQLRRGEHVHHRNENPSDNRPENLEVLTVREHRRKHGKCTLTDEQIADLMRAGYTTGQLRAEFSVHAHRAVYARRLAGLQGLIRHDHDAIRRLLAAGLSGSETARRLGCSPATVSAVRHGHR